jgi:Zn-finger nucleic acid-binding protein
LHERDLDTVCPNCLALVSSQARFCHHCGTRLAAETVARDQTSLACPVCGDSQRLFSRQMGRVAALECGSCAGVWLGNAAFEQLTENAAEAAKKQSRMFSDRTVRARDASGLSASDQPPRYRPCPECGSLMLRRQYGRRSGIVIDVCRKHGIWFDAEELPRILDWIRRGGLAQAQAELARETKLAKRTASRTTTTGGALPSTFSTEEPERGLLDFAIDTIAYWVMRRLGS